MSKILQEDKFGPRVRGVYALEDPRDDRVRYVGSSVHVLARYRAHLTTGGNSAEKKKFAEFILPLRRQKALPRLVLLELVGEGESLAAAEFAWIARYRALEQADFNVMRRQTKSTLRIAELEARVAELEALLELV